MEVTIPNKFSHAPRCRKVCKKMNDNRPGRCTFKALQVHVVCIIKTTFIAMTVQFRFKKSEVLILLISTSKYNHSGYIHVHACTIQKAASLFRHFPILQLYVYTRQGEWHAGHSWSMEGLVAF